MKSFKYLDLVKSGGINAIDDNKPDDLFFACASYETRTYAVADALSEVYKCKKAFVIINKEFRLEGEKSTFIANQEVLTNSLKNHCDDVSTVLISWLDVTEQVLSLRECIVSLPEGFKPERISIDITTFTRESLLTIISLLREQFPKARIRTLYTSPMQHGEWLSRGVRMIRNVMGFPGTQIPSLPTLLVVLTGFEQERTMKIINGHDPSKVLIGFGHPATSSSFYERNWNEQEFILSHSSNVETFEFPTTSMNLGVIKLEEILSPYYNCYNIIIAPMNTKLSTLATLIMTERHPEIQITYGVPNEYNVDSYSSGVNEVYLEFLPPILRGS